MSDEARRLVERGYDRMADRFDEWRHGIEGSPEIERVGDLIARLPKRPDVLELGSGAGVAPTRLLAERGRLTGVDISAEQVRRAREGCPQARFIHADFTKVAFEEQSFDAVVSLYVFNHVPRADVRPLLGKIAGWLRPGGYLLATFGISGGESVEADWLGVPMFFASHTEEENRELLRSAGLEIERDEVVPIMEPEDGEARFQWVLAALRPSSPAAGDDGRA